MSLSFRDHRFEPPKYSAEECKDKDMTYSAPMFVTAEFINNTTGEIKSQTVFMGDFPLMTHKGTFIINGTERVVVSPARPFARASTSTARSTRPPTRTSTAARSSRAAAPGWSSRSTSATAVGVRIDRKRKQSVTVLLKALGWDDARILEHFGELRVDARHPGEGPHHQPGRGPARHLPQAAPGRAADARGRADAAGQPLLQRRSATTWPRSAATRSTRSSAEDIRQGRAR